MSNVDIVRRLMSATITDSNFLRGLRAIWREDLAGESWRWLARQCFSYLDTYGSAPGKNIEAIWASLADEEIKADLEQLLAGLSSEYEEEDSFNADFLLQEAENYFGCEVYAIASAELEAAADAGDVGKAERILAELNPPKLAQIRILNPFLDTEGFKKALETKAESLVELGGAFQEMVGEQIVPDSLVGLLGYKKSNKSRILQEIAFGAGRKRNNVYYAQCGDLSDDQQKIRFAIQMTGRNLREKYNQALLSPILDCERNQEDDCDRNERMGCSGCIEKPGKPYPWFSQFDLIEKEYIPCCARCPDWRPTTWWERVPACPDLTIADVVVACSRLFEAQGDWLRYDWFPQKRATFAEIDRRLEVLSVGPTKWVPKLVCPDYPDIFAPEPGSERAPRREQEDIRWSAARRLSQKWGCCVVLPTQANRSTKARRILRANDVSEADWKAAHCTAFFGINCDDHDKRRNWIRINSMMAREDESIGTDQIVVMHLISRGRVNLGSFWWKQLEEE